MNKDERSSIKCEALPDIEEAAAIVAALGRVHGAEPDAPESSRWRLAGLFGHAVPTHVKLERSLWSYRGCEGMV